MASYDILKKVGKYLLMWGYSSQCKVEELTSCPEYASPYFRSFWLSYYENRMKTNITNTFLNDSKHERSFIVRVTTG